jgi:hypothetical protein
MSQHHEDTFLPVQRISFALSKARHLLTADMDVELAGTGVSTSHIGALLLLYVDLARTSAGLSRALGVDAGFVTRPDRRVVNLTLTEAGRDLAAQIAEIAPTVLNRRLCSFTPLEFATLCGLLHKLLDE